MNTDSVLIVGIGSAHGDDRLGWLVADAVKQILRLDHLEIKLAKSPVDLLDWIDEHKRLIICDSCQGLGTVGQAHCWTWPAIDFSSVTFSGTHDLPLPVVLQLAERLGRLNCAVQLWAIEGASSHAGDFVSTTALESVNAVARQIVLQLTPSNPVTANRCTSNL
jgi:hydrogenase maturation protease